MIVRTHSPGAGTLCQLLLIGASAWLVAAPVAAQSALERVEQLTRLGRADEAREALMEWWEGDRDDASRRDLQRGLWLRGRLTVDPQQAELDFQRLAVLYPSGQFTPDAIMRLAQASFAMGDEEGAQRYVATLVRDYPRSEARERAEAWLADAGPVPPPGDTPTQVGEETAQDPVDDPADSEAETDPPADDPPEDPPAGDDPSAEDAQPTEEAAAEPVMNYYVQLGAFADEARAFALHEEVSAQGVEVRVVRVEGSRFTHVRVGRFAQREDAVEALDELTAQGISAALVRDDRPESPAR